MYILSFLNPTVQLSAECESCGHAVLTEMHVSLMTVTVQCCMADKCLYVFLCVVVDYFHSSNLSVSPVCLYS